MAAFLDLCRFTPSAGGTADWTYSSTVSPYISPTAAGAVNGRVYKVRAESTDLTQWEVSEGTYNSSGAGSFARTTVLYNSAGTGALQSGAGSKINFTAPPQVWVVASKRDLISVEEANGFTTAQKTQAKANIGLSTPVAVAEGGTGVTAIPSFQAYRSTAQSIPANSNTKLQLNTEEWDTHGYYDNATNYRFTPGVAGKYLVIASVTLDSISPGVKIVLVISKNGADYKYGRMIHGSLTEAGSVNVSALVDMNGSTDYVEFFVVHESTGARNTRAGSLETFASGVRIAP